MGRGGDEGQRMSDVVDYIKVYNGWFSAKECKSKIRDLKKAKWEKHSFAIYDETGISISGDKELTVSYGDESDNAYMMQRIWDGIHHYITELNMPWFNGWNGFSQVRYNRYEPGQTMAMHCDHINTLFDGQRKGIPILSVVGLMNDNYTGGEFIMCGKEIELMAGDLLVFPSVFMYPHMVNPVTTGVRYSLVSWVW
jgi:hypothetical protein